jgi:hypothetical protein
LNTHLASSVDAIWARVKVSSGGENMISAFAMLLIVLWALGLATSHTGGGFIHALLVAGVAILVVRLVRKQRNEKTEAAARLKRRREMIRKAGHY